MKPTKEQVEAGQSIYTKRILSAYDLIVLGISNRYIWNCSSARLEEHYNQHISANHLDVGVGTGYFLDRCQFPSKTPRVALMDLNPNALEYTSKRISRYQPETYKHNVLEPISTNIRQFDSVGINYLLHCIPGSISDKAIVFDRLARLVNQNGVIFGSTILYGGITKNFAAKWLMNVYNKKGIFSNTTDDLLRLEDALKQKLRDVSIEVVGCVALFSGHYF